MNPEQAEAIMAQNQQLQQMVAQQQQILHQRNEPTFCSVLDALVTLTQMARAGHPAAQDLLKKWRTALREAEAAADAIAVVSSFTPNGRR